MLVDKGCIRMETHRSLIPIVGEAIKMCFDVISWLRVWFMLALPMYLDSIHPYVMSENSLWPRKYRKGPWWCAR